MLDSNYIKDATNAWCIAYNAALENTKNPTLATVAAGHVLAAIKDDILVKTEAPKNSTFAPYYEDIEQLKKAALLRMAQKVFCQEGGEEDEEGTEDDAEDQR